VCANLLGRDSRHFHTKEASKVTSLTHFLVSLLIVGVLPLDLVKTFENWVGKCWIYLCCHELSYPDHFSIGLANALVKFKLPFNVQEQLSDIAIFNNILLILRSILFNLRV